MYLKMLFLVPNDSSVINPVIFCDPMMSEPLYREQTEWPSTVHSVKVEMVAKSYCHCIHVYQMQVLSDGAIVFDRPIKLYDPITFPLEGELAGFQVVAPFLADHDPRLFGSVRYKVYSNPNQNMKLVSEFIRNKNYSSDFDGTWMLVAEWKDVPQYPATLPISKVSFVEWDLGGWGGGCECTSKINLDSLHIYSTQGISGSKKTVTIHACTKIWIQNPHQACTKFFTAI